MADTRGGVGVIGSSKVLIEQDSWRVLLDMGLDFSPKPDLFRGRVAPRADHVLRDRLRTGAAPWLPHLYRPEAVAGLDLAGGSDERTALFITDAHPDHVGLIGWVDGKIPIYGSPETQRIVTALEDSGMGYEGRRPALKTVGNGASVTFGPFRVTRLPVDPDRSVGVCGRDGRRTGGLHRRHSPTWSPSRVESCLCRGGAGMPRVGD